MVPDQALGNDTSQTGSKTSAVKMIERIDQEEFHAHAWLEMAECTWQPSKLCPIQMSKRSDNIQNYVRDMEL